MEIKELTDILVSSLESNRAKYVPWWEDDFENCMYSYEMFSKEDIENITECIKNCEKEVLFTKVGCMGLSLFHLLVWHNFYDVVKTLIDEGADVNISAVEGQGILKDVCIGATPLMLACYQGNLNMVKLLIEAGADTKAVDEKGRNAYHYLCSYIYRLPHEYQCMQSSLAFRKDIACLLTDGINQKDENGMTPLQVMLNDDNSNLSWALTKAFIDKGAKTDMFNDDGDSLLIIAIKNYHITAALELSNNKELINKTNNEGRTPLHYAVDNGSLELCMALMDKGADKNIKDNNDISPKDMALDDDWNEEMEKYFKSGRIDMNNLSRLTSNSFARFSEEHRDNISIALYLAGKLINEADPDDDDEMQQVLGIMYNALLQDEDCQVLELCKKAGLDFVQTIYRSGSMTCIRDECLGGNYGIKVIKKFIDMGVDMNEAVVKGRTPANIVASLQKRTMFSREKDDYFEKAAEFFSKESMEQLDNNGTSAIHYAAKNEHLEMLQVMIDKGVDINITEDEPANAGNTPLHTACESGKAKMAELLIKSGADDTLKNIKGNTPAHLITTNIRFGREIEEEDRLAVLEVLKNVDIPSNDGRTPLMLAQSFDINTSTSITKLLIDKGVDVNHADNDGNTALILNAKNNCYKGVIKELIKAGADVNAYDKLGNSALYYALKYGDLESSRFMIKKGADFNHANNEGVTPMEVAVENGYDSIIELMYE